MSSGNFYLNRMIVRSRCGLGKSGIGIKELAISRKTVLYRDVRGNCFYGIISALQFDQDRYSTDFSISLLRVDHVGRIEYDPAEV